MNEMNVQESVSLTLLAFMEDRRTRMVVAVLIRVCKDLSTRLVNTLLGRHFALLETKEKKESEVIPDFYFFGCLLFAALRETTRNLRNYGIR